MLSKRRTLTQEKNSLEKSLLNAPANTSLSLNTNSKFELIIKAKNKFPIEKCATLNATETQLDVQEISKNKDDIKLQILQLQQQKEEEAKKEILLSQQRQQKKQMLQQLQYHSQPQQYPLPQQILKQQQQQHQQRKYNFPPMSIRPPQPLPPPQHIFHPQLQNYPLQHFPHQIPIISISNQKILLDKHRIRTPEKQWITRKQKFTFHNIDGSYLCELLEWEYISNDDGWFFLGRMNGSRFRVGFCDVLKGDVKFFL